MEVEPSVQEQKGNKDNVDAIVAAIERRKASRLPSVERALTRPLGHRSDFVFGNRSSSADVDEYILEFLDPKDHASLAATSRALLRAVDKVTSHLPLRFPTVPTAGSLSLCTHRCLSVCSSPSSMARCNASSWTTRAR